MLERLQFLSLAEFPLVSQAFLAELKGRGLGHHEHVYLYE